MKKIISIILGFMFLFSLTFIGCGKEKTELTFYAPDGAPSLSVAKFIYDNENFDTDKILKYNIVKANIISTAITVEKADFILLPLNLAAKLYDSDKDNMYKMAAVITHGNFYFVAKRDLQTDDFMDKTIVVSQSENSIPDLTLRCWLEEKNLGEKVNFNYTDNATNAIGVLATHYDYIGFLPEPAVSKFLSAHSDYVKSDFMEFPQAVLLVKNSTAENYPDIVEKMQNKFSENVDWVKNNTTDAVNAIKEKFAASELSADGLTKVAIDGCKIEWKNANEERDNIKEYLQKITQIAPNVAKQVEDDFFYGL